MGGATNCPETPRQKMIAMMYLVLTAMLALNVSAEILNGYTLVDETMRKSIAIGEARNLSLESQFESMASQNPAKAKEWVEKSNEVKVKSDELYNVVSNIQKRIIVLVDKDQADTVKLVVSENGRSELNIPSQVGMMESPDKINLKSDAKKIGEALRLKVNEYLTFMQGIVAKDTVKVASLANMFDTKDIENKKEPGQKKKWESGVFEDMPAIATLTVLSKIKNDIRNAQAEAVQYCMSQVDAGDFRVNKIEAIVRPVSSSYVMRGGKYEAQIILAATDSTKPLQIEVNGKPLEKDMFKASCGSVGKFPVKGTVKMTKPDGTVVPYDFNSEYIVAEPQATVSADMMNVFYAGFQNPVSVSVPGVSSADVTITVSNANITKTAKGWNVKPIKPGVEAKVTVSAKVDGKSQVITTKSFRVKPLPPPLAMLPYKKGTLTEKHKGGKIAKNFLVTVEKVIAELDDADLDVKYNVLSFQLNSFDSMGNTIVEMSGNDNLTPKQKDVFKKLVKGKSVYITNVKAKGPDGITRTLPPLEVSLK